MMPSESSQRSSRRKASHLNSYGVLTKSGFMRGAYNIAKNLSPIKSSPATNENPPEATKDDVYLAWSGFNDGDSRVKEMVSRYDNFHYHLHFLRNPTFVVSARICHLK